jgi:peptide/nickel transport system ATP-binding protein
MREESLLVAEGVSVDFGDFRAVDDAHISVGQNEIVGIVGESGSGKTTLARVAVGLQRPTTGRVLIDGEPFVGSGAPRRRSRTDVQMVFQDPYSSLNPRQTALEAVAEAVHVRKGLPMQQARDQALSLLESIGIGAALAERRPSRLSGGQRQRVSFARALAAEPKLLVADEPTSALDQSAQAQLLNLLRQIQRERSLAVLLISHDLGVISYLTQRVYVMRHGRIVESGETVQLFRSPQEQYTKDLLGAIPGRSSGRMRSAPEGAQS